MTYTHLTTDEVTIIESYFHQGLSVSTIQSRLHRARQTIYNVMNYFKQGYTAIDYMKQYKDNKKKCGRKPIALPEDQQTYIQKKVTQGWTPDVIKGRNDYPIDCSMRTLYRQFQKGYFDRTTLPMKGKRKRNGYKEKRGKQAFKRSLDDRTREYPDSKDEFGHLEGDTIVGKHHQSAIITLVECVSKVIITLKPAGRKAENIEDSLITWLQRIPKNLFKSITFDCGKEFSNWKNISNQGDIDIYFADPGTPSQRALNENSNGLLRKDGLPKEMDFNEVEETFIWSVSEKRNHIPRKSLDYQTPMEIFLNHIDDSILSSLI